MYNRVLICILTLSAINQKRGVVITKVGCHMKVAEIRCTIRRGCFFEEPLRDAIHQASLPFAADLASLGVTKQAEQLHLQFYFKKI